MIKTVCDFCGKTLKSEKRETIGNVWASDATAGVMTINMTPVYEGLDMCEQCFKDAKKRRAK